MRDGLKKIVILLGMLSSLNYALDLDLAKAVRLARTQNLALQSSKSQAESARINAQLSHASLGPTLTASSSLSQTTRLDEQGASARWGADLTLSQSIDFSKFTESKSRDITYQASIKQADASETSLTASVIFAYFVFLRDSLQINRMQQDLKNQQDKLDKIKAEILVGNRAETEALQQEAVVAQSETSLIGQLRTTEDSKATLVAFLGEEVSPDTVRVHFDSLTLFHNQGELMDTIFLSDTTSKSLAVQSQELRIEAAKTSIKAARQQYLPTFTLGASLNHEDPIWTDPSSNTESSQYVSLSARIQFRILDGGTRSAQIQQDQLTLEDAQRSRSQLQQDESLALRKAKRQFENSLAKRNAASKSLVATQRALQSIQEQYNLGAANLLDLHQTELQFHSAQTVMIDSQFECLVAYIAVRNAQNHLDQALSELSVEKNQ